jgi:hypothetical protein
MFRCAYLACVFLTAATPALAQSPRNFPATALRGEIVVVQPPEIALNGRSARLAPGARIRDPQNLLALSGTLVGQALPVHYTIDPLGLVLEVWILTDAERARQPWPSTPEQAAAWHFDPVAQTWSPR